MRLTSRAALWLVAITAAAQLASCLFLSREHQTPTVIEFNVAELSNSPQQHQENSATASHPKLTQSTLERALRGGEPPRASVPDSQDAEVTLGRLGDEHRQSVPISLRSPRGLQWRLQAEYYEATYSDEEQTFTLTVRDSVFSTSSSDKERTAPRALTVDMDGGESFEIRPSTSPLLELKPGASIFFVYNPRNEGYKQLRLGLRDSQATLQQPGAQGNRRDPKSEATASLLEPLDRTFEIQVMSPPAIPVLHVSEKHWKMFIEFLTVATGLTVVAAGVTWLFTRKRRDPKRQIGYGSKIR